jgi:UDP-N-acetylmuramoyl-L-alanyl-D-glutamate--2,6-diaminopimelate ligase
MKLQEILAGVEIVQTWGPAEIEIETVECDSRDVVSGSVFFALQGVKTDGIQHVPEAIARGAVAIVAETPPNQNWYESAAPLAADSPKSWIQVVAPRPALALAAANFYRHPSRDLQLVGVTGTNGKTTVSYLVDSILRAAGRITGLAGTVEWRTPARSRKPRNTTPDALELQRMFAEVRDAGGSSAVLEVSSHSLMMDRLWGCHFAAAVFTNLTHDHLDFHGDSENYFLAKRRLFEGTGADTPDVAIINTDDSRGVALKGLAGRTVTYGLRNGAQITARKVQLSLDRLDFTANTPEGPIEVRSSLIARINIYNILAAIGAAQALGISSSDIEQGIRALESVPGRFQRVNEGQPFLVIADYAHADDALRNLIATARELVGGGRIITLFGAGGNRDRGTRPLMGEAAGSLSDLVVLTSDNPRTEDPARIINDVMVGLQKANATYLIELDRERAIELAFREARAGDIVLLAGKGHENYQILKDRTFEFDDREVAHRLLRKIGFAKDPDPS